MTAISSQFSIIMCGICIACILNTFHLFNLKIDAIGCVVSKSVLSMMHFGMKALSRNSNEKLRLIKFECFFFVGGWYLFSVAANACCAHWMHPLKMINFRLALGDYCMVRMEKERKHHNRTMLSFTWLLFCINTTCVRILKELSHCLKKSLCLSQSLFISISDGGDGSVEKKKRTVHHLKNEPCQSNLTSSLWFAHNIHGNTIGQRAFWPHQCERMCAASKNKQKKMSQDENLYQWFIAQKLQGKTTHTHKVHIIKMKNCPI